jgi:hypothetical protein
VDDRPLEHEDAIRARLHRDLGAVRVAPYAQYRDAALARTRPRSRALRLAGPIAAGAVAIVLALVLGLALGNARRNAAAPQSSVTDLSAGQDFGACATARQRVLGMRSVVIRADRVEAKHMSARDFIDRSPGGDSPGLRGKDLDTTMLCVVAVAGQLRPQLGLIDHGPYTYAVFVSLAGSDESLTSLFGSDGNWPAYFDALPNAPVAIFLPRCPTSSRPQQELDFAGLPPLVPSGPLLRCLMVASVGGSAYDSGYSAGIELSDGRPLSLYERRSSRPDKAGPSQVTREGSRDVAGTTWSWSVLANGHTTLSAVTQGSYVELALPGDESQVDTLAAIAATLRPVESLPRPPARQICAALDVGSRSRTTVAAAFDSSAASVARLVEQPAWRARPPGEPVAICYLDGDFGEPRGPPPLTGASLRPNWDRVVYFVGVDRHPIAWVWGWQHSIPLEDPGP